MDVTLVDHSMLWVVGADTGFGETKGGRGGSW